jgi:hypothetical protein
MLMYIWVVLLMATVISAGLWLACVNWPYLSKEPFLVPEWIKFWAQLTGIAVATSGLLVALFNPGQIRKDERVDAVAGYRNLACYATRWVETVLPGVRSDKKWPKDEAVSFQVIQYSLNGIDLKSIYPPDLLEHFVDIYGRIANLRVLADGNKPLTDDLLHADAQVHDDIKAINDYLKEALPLDKPPQDCVKG